jgi:hypothetical protein
VVQNLLLENEDVLQEINKRATRDFERIDRDGQAPEAEVDYAGHLIWSRQAAAAVRFIYERVKALKGLEILHKMPLRFRYIEAFLDMGDLERAEPELDAIRANLIWARDRGLLGPDLIYAHNQRANELELEIKKAQARRLGRQP